MRIAFVLPGLNKVVRGAEVAFESIADELAQRKDVKVTLFGSGEAKKESLYDFISVPSTSRESFESWPKIPIFRDEYVYEEISFLLNFTHHYNPEKFDVTVTCSYPFINWYLRFRGGSKRPAHIFVTQNGDHPVLVNKSEYAFFGCDGLVCTNPEYFERHKESWPSVLIPNGVDPKLFYPGTVQKKATIGLPDNVPVALMVSALIEEKRVACGIEFASEISNLHLVVCGDGPERQKIQELGNKMMPGRFHLREFPRHQMPDVYRESDLFLHMSMTEPSANAYIEALATGLPIVTHDRLVTQWTLENAAILVDTTNKNAVVDGIKKAITMSSSEYALFCQSIVKKRYSWSKLSEEYHDFFFKVLDSKRN